MLPALSSRSCLPRLLPCLILLAMLEESSRVVVAQSAGSLGRSDDSWLAASPTWPALPPHSIVSTRPLSPAQDAYRDGVSQLHKLSPSQLQQRQAHAARSRIVMLGSLDYPEGSMRDFMLAIRRQRENYGRKHNIRVVYENHTSVGRLPKTHYLLSFFFRPTFFNLNSTLPLPLLPLCECRHCRL